MDFEDWDKDAAGRLKVWPLQAFTTAVFEGRAGGVRLEVGVPRDPALPLPAVQITMDAAQLRALADALNDIAAHLETTSN